MWKNRVRASVPKSWLAFWIYGLYGCKSYNPGKKYCINSSKFFSIINSFISGFCCKINSLVSKGFGGKINSLVSKTNSTAMQVKLSG